MNFKRYVEASDTWVDSHYIMGTDTDTITTLPAVLYPNDTTATVGLKGNMSQSGTPTPTTPIQPQECGERTAQLFDISAVTLGKYINASGEEATSSGTGENALNHSDYIPINALTTYTFKCEKAAGYYGTANAFCWFDSSKQLISRTLFTAEDSGTEILGVDTAPAGAVYLIMNYRGRHGDTAMLNSGSTALPYEPYGYKIPISSANTTTPVYLGVVETERAIRKYVFNGTEDWQRAANGAYYLSTLTNPIRDYKYIGGNISINTHFPSQNAVSGSNGVNNGRSAFFYPGSGSGGTREYYIAARDIPTLEDFKSYLAAQYANGTPVCVWYVLATPTTAVVNEPLRKIGDYADEVSGITIPTIAGANTISVDTTLQPSEITVNYKGWHPVADVHERESGAWT